MSRILLIEDDTGDVYLLKEAFGVCGPGVTLQHAASGEEGLALLRSGPKPDLVMLDLNLPGHDGCEVVEEMRKDKALSNLPVLMLTTSQAESDVERAYRSGVNAFMVKPMDLDQLELLAKRICDFWFSSARLPRA